MLVYTDFTDNDPTVVTRVAQSAWITSLTIDTPGDDYGSVPVSSSIELPPVRFSKGISSFNFIRFNIEGPCHIEATVYGKSKLTSKAVPPFDVAETPGREYRKKINLVSEQCSLQIVCDELEENYNIHEIEIEGQHFWDERPNG